jgi:LemA protein
MQASGPAQASAAEGMLSQALGGLRVVAEQYPELRATENFQQLTRNLSELEDEIQASRRIYNSNVQAYNTKIQVFPNSIVANQGGFTAREFFEIEDPGVRVVPTFSFSDSAPAAAPAAAAPAASTPPADAPPAPPPAQ